MRASSEARDGGRVQINLRWLWIPASLLILVLLRRHTVWLSLYVAAVMVGLVLWYIVLPKQALAAERTFHREALRHLAGGDLDGVEALAAKQWLLRRFGRQHVLPDTLALAASARGEHEKARQLYGQALRAAPAEERPRIELNLAAEELATGHLESAEGRYRAALARRPDHTPARANLARLLLRRGEDLPEAAQLAGQAATSGDARERAELYLIRAEALARMGDVRSAAALDDARDAGADPAEIDRVQALAR